MQPLSLGKQLTGTKNDESGIILIEILVAMAIFLVISAGVAGTFITGFRGAVHARLSTLGKAAAQEQMEQMRSLVFFVPYSSNPDIGTTQDIDLLDRYYPNLNTMVVIDGQNWRGWYTHTSTDAYYTKESPADVNGIVKTVETRFIDDTGKVIIPDSGSNYDSKAEGRDTPLSNLVEVSITADWPDLSGNHTYRIVSRISATGQTIPGSGGNFSGCVSNANSHIYITGGLFSISTGTGEPYSPFISGNFGEGQAMLTAGCQTITAGAGRGGKIQVEGLSDPYQGANASVAGPPNAIQQAGPVSVGPTAGWPVSEISGTDSHAKTSIAQTRGGEIMAEGETTVGGLSEQLQQEDGWPGGSSDGYRRWDFLNPTIQVMGGSDPLDPLHPNDQVWANLDQQLGTTLGSGKAFFSQVNILPLEAETADTPSALQGLVFVRSFRANLVGAATGMLGGASVSVDTYSATIGMFNPTKASNCTGDDCYDLYTTIGLANPLQVAVDLSGNSAYRLQNELFTEWHSYTGQEINASTALSGNGTAASVNIDALMKISAKFGTEVRWKTADPNMNTIALIDQQGIEMVWLGALDMALYQEKVL